MFWKIFFLSSVVLFVQLVDGTNYICPQRNDVISLQDVQDAVKASEEIYKPNFDAVLKIPGTNYTILKRFHDTFKEDGQGIKVIIAENGNSIMVVYRGTEGLDQLLMQAKSGIFDDKYELNMNGTKVKILGFFHDAFQLSYNGVKEYLKNSSKKYIITGHSLGGAMASILALSMTQDSNGSVWQHPQSCLITFGQPRVGLRDWADLHDKLIPTFRKLRFVYKSDLVTGIPQRTNGWSHHSRAVYIGSSKSLNLGRKRRFIDSAPYWKVCQDQEDFSCTYDVTTVPNPLHHSITTYYNAILNPPNQYITKAGTKYNVFEDVLFNACSEPKSYYVKSSGTRTVSEIYYSLTLMLVVLYSFF